MNTLLLSILIINCLILLCICVPLVFVAYCSYVDTQHMKKLANTPQKFCSNCDRILAYDEDTGYDETPQEENSTSVKCTRVFI